MTKSAPHGGEVDGKRIEFSVLTFNILEGGRASDLNPAEKDRLSRIRAWIKSKNADLVFLNECNHFTLQSTREMAKEWGHDHVVFGKATSGFHVVLTSRYPFVDKPLVVTQGFRHCFIVARVAFPFGEVTAMATHLTPSIGSERLQEARFIAGYVRKRDQVETLLIYFSPSCASANLTLPFSEGT
jgi:endonuclease/exonuclease/phosphatase family metal-dependent hydrolase